MDLKLQILSILFSFGYGIISSYLYNLNYNFIHNTTILYKLVINILFCVNLGLIYFILIKVINYGVVHVYFVFSFVVGFVLFVNKYKSLRNVFKVKK